MRLGARSSDRHTSDRHSFAVRKVFGGVPAALFGIIAAAICALSAAAQDGPARSPASEEMTPLAQLAQLAVKKGFKYISLGDVCDRLHIGITCKAYQLNAAIDAAESQTFSLPAGWQTSLNVLPQRGGGANVVITEHDDHIGYGYLIGPDESLRAVTVGLSSSGDGKNWRWKPASISDEIARKFALEKAYWLAQIKDIQALPDRKD